MKLSIYLLIIGITFGAMNPRHVSGEDVTYEYDQLGRLTKARYPGVGGISYTYDAASNMRTRTVTLTPPYTHTFELPAGWSIVSLPCQVEDPSLDALFPTALSLFAFDNGRYVRANRLLPGVGYWINMPSPAVEVTDCEPFMSGELLKELDGGWSLMGPGNVELDVSGLQDTYGFLSSVFGFDRGRGYTVSETMVPGLGYWMNLSEAGSIDLSGSVAPTDGVTKRAVPLLVGTDGQSGHTASSVSHEPAEEAVAYQPGQFHSTLWAEVGDLRQPLYLGVEASEVMPLPPTPPSNMFDARFNVDGVDTWQLPAGSESHEFRLRIQGGVERLHWQMSPEASRQWTLVVDGQTTDLDGEGSVSVEMAASLAIRRSAVRPLAFALHHGYPNPFNPTTMLRFDLPSAGTVHLRIYDVSGQLVRKLVGGHRPAGQHAVEWHGRNDRGDRVGSGVYFCALRAGSDRAVCRMVLIK